MVNCVPASQHNRTEQAEELFNFKRGIACLIPLSL